MYSIRSVRKIDRGSSKVWTPLTAIKITPVSTENTV
jgi:hypothetical protein